MGHLTTKMWDTKKSNKQYTIQKGKLEYKKFRVRTPIKTFRDLDVYKDTTKLAAGFFNLEPINSSEKLMNEIEMLRKLSKYIPRMIAESYSNKFDNFTLSQAKLEKASELISDIIAKLDFLLVLSEEDAVNKILAESLTKYQLQRRKILNLKHAWQRVQQNYQKYQSQTR